VAGALGFLDHKISEPLKNTEEVRREGMAVIRDAVLVIAEMAPSV
jgi:hypothetical protein